MVMPVMPVMPWRRTSRTWKNAWSNRRRPDPWKPIGTPRPRLCRLLCWVYRKPKKGWTSISRHDIFIYFPSNFEVFNFSLSCLRLLYIHRFYGTFILRCSWKPRLSAQTVQSLTSSVEEWKRLSEEQAAGLRWTRGIPELVRHPQ